MSPKQLSPGSRLPHSSAVSDLSMAFSGRKRRGLNPCNLVPHKPINLHKPKPTQTYTNCLKNSWKFIARLQVDLESTNHNPAKICHEPRFVSWFILIPPSAKPVAFLKLTNWYITKTLHWILNPELTFMYKETINFEEFLKNQF